MFSDGFLLKGVAGPAICAFLATLLFKRILNGARGSGALGFAAGQALGVWLVRSVDNPLWPTRNLQWPPWLAVTAAFIGPMLVAGGLIGLERWLLAAFVAAAAASVLVPTWPDLWPARPMSIALFVMAVSLVARGSDGLARRLSPRIVAVALAAVAVEAAMLIAASLSLSLGESALTTAAALAGTAAALLIRPDEAAVRGLCLPAAVGVGGWCYVAAIEQPPPAPVLVALLGPPAIPLLLWLVAVGPASRWSSRSRLIACVILMAAGLAAVGAWAWFSTENSPEY